MNAFFSRLSKFAEWGSVASLVGMIFVVALQVFARAFLTSAPSWTEELARFFFVYAVAFGIGVAVREDGLVRLEFIGEYVSARVMNAILLVIDICALAFAILLTVVSWRFVHDGWAESSPALGVSMGVAFSSVLLIFASLAIFCVERIMKRLGRGGEIA